MSWNHPEMRERVLAVDEEWRTVLTEAFAPALEESGSTFRSRRWWRSS